MKEIWKPIEWYVSDDFVWKFNPKYEVSNTCKIRKIDTKEVVNSFFSDHPEKQTKKQHPKWRLTSINKNNKGCNRPHIILARLIAQYFIEILEEDNNFGHYDVDHIDENPCNLNIENLQWCTYAENISYNKTHKHITSIKQRRILD